MIDTTAVSRYGSRKFLLSLLVFGVASLFLCCGLIAASDWMKLATATLALYGLANVAQKATTKAPADPAAPAASSPPA